MKIGKPGGDSRSTPVGLMHSQVGAGEVEGNLEPGGFATPFDAAKVERILQAISDGTYKIDAGAIADKLIAETQWLIGRVSP